MNEPILQFFDCDFSEPPTNLEKHRALFHRLAWGLAATVPWGPERVEMFRHLLLAKEAAMRALVYKDLTGDEVLGLIRK